jgi:hypothetical protein
LLDLGQDWEALSASENPFATVVMAHLKAGQTKKNRQERFQWKLSLTRQLYQGKRTLMSIKQTKKLLA